MISNSGPLIVQVVDEGVEKSNQEELQKDPLKQNVDEGRKT